MKKISKLIAILMSVLMVFLMLPVSAFAVNSEIESISVEMTTTLTEHIDGYIDYDYNEVTDDWDLEYFYYYYDDRTNITVNYKDGTSISGNDYEIYENTGYWV